MRTFTDKELLDRVASLPSFTHWPNHLEVYVRSKADQFDAFDDKFFSYAKQPDGSMKFIMARNGTTNAGSYGLLHFNEYNHLGCAVLKSDEIVYDSHVWGHHKHIPNAAHEAYVQVKPFPYFRDNNRNERAEEIGPVFNDVIGANIHRAGVNSTVIKNWSTACLVTANLARFLMWLDYLVKAGKPPVSLCILKEFD